MSVYATATLIFLLAFDKQTFWRQKEARHKCEIRIAMRNHVMCLFNMSYFSPRKKARQFHASVLSFLLNELVSITSLSFTLAESVSVQTFLEIQQLNSYYV